MLVMLVKTCFQRDSELVKKSFVEKNVEVTKLNQKIRLVKEILPKFTRINFISEVCRIVLLLRR